MKFMTWNMRLGIQAGLSPIARLVADEAPDVVALQEVGRRWVMGPTGDPTAALAVEAGFDHHFFVPSLAWYPPAQYGHALLCRTPLVRPTIHRLPQFIDEPRTFLSTTISAGDLEFVCVTTHLSHVGDRTAQGVYLVDWLERLDSDGRRFVLMGDLNEDELTTAWMERLRGFAHCAPVDEPTYPADAPRARIDWIWANFGVWDDAKVIRGEHVATATDHLPVVAQLDPAG